MWAWGFGTLAMLTACGGTGAAAAGDSGQSKDSTGAAPGATQAAAPDRAAAATVTGDAHTVLFVGTSLTAGLGLDPDSAYPALIQRKIDSAGLDFHVVNAGVSGETSAGALGRISWLLRQPFDVMVLETGANDGLRGTPVTETRDNIQAIIDTVRRRRPGVRIALVQMEAPPNLGTAYTRAFHETFPLLARRNGLVLIPFLLDGVAGHAALNQGDGMHPNNDGERMVASNVWRTLEPVLRGAVGRGGQ
jgi:acyl-CoA thioesterase-1